MTTKNETGCGTTDCCNTSQDGYWQDVEQKVQDPEVLKQEFQDGDFDTMTVEKSRRSFLKIMGFSVSALPLASCNFRVPVKKALPYIYKNDTIIPGVPNWFASTFKGEPILVKTREGRPIKIEGNDKSSWTKGGTGTVQQGSVVELYDSNRLRKPMIAGKDSDWNTFDVDLKMKLEAIKAEGKEIVLVTPSMHSPSTSSLIADFKKHFGKVSHVGFDAISTSAISKANKITFGTEASNEYRLDKSDIVISFEGDFLGTMANSTAYSKQWSTKRNPEEGTMLRHVQIEARLTLTGSNADSRFTKSYADQKNILIGVLAGLGGAPGVAILSENKDLVNTMVAELSKSKGKSLVMSGLNDVDVQVVVNKINDILGNYGNTINAVSSKYDFHADDAAFESFVTETASGKRDVGAVLLWDVNPAYSYYNTAVFKKALEKVSVRVSFASSADETSTLCTHVAPNNHALESWQDTIVSSSELSVTQPVVQALYGSRQATETLIATMGQSVTFYDYMKKFWSKNLMSKQSKFATTDGFWNNTLHDGVVTLKGLTSSSVRGISSVASSVKSLAATEKSSTLTISCYEKGAIGNGEHANNPWLQECPDAITKATWGNYAMLSPSYAKAHGIKLGDVVKVKSNNYSVELPVLVQAGLEKNTVAIAMGYGRTVGGKVALGTGTGLGSAGGKGLGSNSYGFITFSNGTFQYTAEDLNVNKTGKFEAVATTQTHHSMEGRDIVRESTLKDFKTNPNAGNEKKVKIISMWKGHKSKGHKWGMVIDMNKCTGCSSCIVSCNVENNVPVVGKEEVVNRREMHWLRLDRYYKDLPSGEVETVHQPMLCQHCDNAPCETVCPVIATSQSSDGLNQQTYNRCIGTRYCANNCPYKVRRFNWFDYPHNDLSENMVLNPDVAVRTRGIMEKCSMCVQRIQAGKLVAKKEGRKLGDDDIKLACQQSCSTDAVVFGDTNNPASRISKLLENSRRYKVLEEINVQPVVNYLTKIRNK